MSPRKRHNPAVNVVCPAHGPTALRTPACGKFRYCDKCDWVRPFDHTAVLTPRTKPLVKR